MPVPPETLEIVRGLITKSEHDLEAARRILAIAEGCPHDTACFHCQQAVEKSLKAYLTCTGVAAPRLHDLEPLYSAVAPAVDNLPPLEAVVALNAFAVQVRYADEYWEPAREDADQALATATQVRTAVLAALARVTGE